MKKVVVLTATRAEYGLLRPLIIKLKEYRSIDVRLAVTGAHLSTEFGMTVQEIESDGLGIDRKIEILLSSDSPVGVSKSMGLALISFAEYFDDVKPDALIVLGDRYEALAVCCAAMNARVAVFHLYGGESTEGAVDEAARHAMTKMAYLHFTSTKRYRKRVIQMGEDPARVFNVGALGVENALSVKTLGRAGLEESLGASLGDCFAVGTFHPVTLENASAKRQAQELLEAVDANPGIRYLFTKANADADGRAVNQILGEYAKGHGNFILADSLGTVRYLSALRHASFVIGNSSSGLIEAPSFGIPTIDIGDRQKGRERAESVIHCRPQAAEINRAIKEALSKGFQEKAKGAGNPYGNGGSSDKIASVIGEFLLCREIDIKKKFYDIDYEEGR